MQQLLLWLGLLELISGVPAIIQTLKGSERMPGDFGHAPPPRPPQPFFFTLSFLNYAVRGESFEAKLLVGLRPVKVRV